MNQIAGYQRSGPATIPLPEMSMASRPLGGSRRAIGGQAAALQPTNRNGHVNDSTNALSGNLRLDAEHVSLSSPPYRPPRVALYSHDTMGLGHLRRNLLIAQSLAQSPLQATSLLITGAHEANFFSLPMGADCFTLPRLRKERDGNYIAGQLAIPIEELICLRAEAINSALATFQPDVLVVDKVPTGAFGEMLPSLRALARRSGARCVLGIRDVLDAPEIVHAEWKEAASQQVIDDFFDEIWVYGDRHVYDPVQEYGWPEPIASKVRFTGYLNQASRLLTPETNTTSEFDCLGTPNDRLVVCTLGGGQDGYELSKAFVESLPATGHFGVLLAGPFMPAERLRRLQETAATRDNLMVLEFTPEADQLISRADRVIAMGGYNTVCSILSFQKHALVVPRVFPRQEQWIRAQRLEELGLIDVLHPQQLSPASLRQWMMGEPTKSPQGPSLLDLNGLEQVQQLCGALIGQQPEQRGKTPQQAGKKPQQGPQSFMEKV